MDKQFVVCVSEGDYHTEQSVIRRCDTCFCNVWCSTHNLIRIPVCMTCAMKLPNPQFFLNHENLAAAIEELKKMMEVDGT